MARNPRPDDPRRLADPDLVDRIFEYIREEFPEIPSARVADLRAATRAEFGGDRQYIRTDRRRALAAEALRLFNGRNATEVARRLGISRATVFRLLKQPGTTS